MEKTTVRSKLVAFQDDGLGYITYVFKLLDEFDQNRLRELEVMCVRFPNWDHNDITIGEEGYLLFVEVIAGVDKYFKNNEFIPYNYHNVQFLKFVRMPKCEIEEEIVLD